ncbi:hypothetical protein [Streptomyces sp. NPDC002490]|uniref:hypothetical protein n=1 Tax=Streptomyces sp. NPDC002490 TaxID=3154416 RepID=UPI00331FFFB0
MRPIRFTDFVIDLVKNQPTVSRVQTLAEAGDKQHPRGIVITTGTREARWQFVGQLPEGAKHDSFDDAPVTGTPAPASPEPRTDDAPEAWFAAALAQAENPEIAGIERWSTREGEREGNQGVTVHFQNGARIFARLM